VRTIYTGNKVEIDFYKPGKIFKFINIISAYKQDRKNTPKEEKPIVGLTMIRYHIYS